MFVSLFLALGFPSLVKAKLFSLLLAAIPIGAISFALYQFVKRQSVRVDEIANPWVHRSVVAGISFILTAVFAALNVPIVCPEGVNCLSTISQDQIEVVLKALLGAVSAFALHAGKSSATK